MQCRNCLCGYRGSQRTYPLSQRDGRHLIGCGTFYGTGCLLGLCSGVCAKRRNGVCLNQRPCIRSLMEWQRVEISMRSEKQNMYAFKVSLFKVSLWTYGALLIFNDFVSLILLAFPSQCFRIVKNKCESCNTSSRGEQKNKRSCSVGC